MLYGENGSRTDLYDENGNRTDLTDAQDVIHDWVTRFITQDAGGSRQQLPGLQGGEAVWGYGAGRTLPRK